MREAFQIILEISLAIHILLIAVSVWRVWRGENVIDRLIGADLITTLTLGILVLVSLLLLNNIYLDVAIAIAFLGFVSTIALAKYVVEQSMF